MLLAFVNEFDPVPRSDNDYIRSLVNLYRSRFQLPAVVDRDGSDKTSRILISAAKSSQLEAPQKPTSDPDAAPPVWPLPPSHLAVAGEIVVLRDANPDGAEIQVGAVLVSPQEFSNLLFVRSAVHSRAIYLDNIERITRGLLSGGQS